MRHCIPFFLPAGILISEGCQPLYEIPNLNTTYKVGSPVKKPIGMLIAVSLFDRNCKRSGCTFVLQSNNFVKFKTYRTWHLH